jgi:hypothetical protein
VTGTATFVDAVDVVVVDAAAVVDAVVDVVVVDADSKVVRGDFSPLSFELSGALDSEGLGPVHLSSREYL